MNNVRLDIIYDDFQYENENVSLLVFFVISIMYTAQSVLKLAQKHYIGQGGDRAFDGLSINFREIFDQCDKQTKKSV